MPIRVKLPNGKVGVFPDGMDHSEIEAVLQKQFGAPKEERSFLSKLAPNIATGVAEMGRGLLNTPHNLANLVGLGDRVANLAPTAEEFDYRKAFGLEGEPTLADKLIQGFAQYAPSIALPGANIGKASKAIGSIPKIGKFLAGATEQAIPQAAFGATQNQNPLIGAAESAAGSAAGSVLGAALGKGIDALRPSKIYKSPLTKKELANAYRQAEGTNADLGNIIQNPKLQRLYENVLPKQTGLASTMMQQTGKQIVEKGEGILKKLLGKNDPENVTKLLTKNLTSAYHKNRDLKEKIYKSVDDIAHEHDFYPDLTKFAQKAKDYIGAIKDTTLLKHEPEINKTLNKLLKYEEPTEKIAYESKILDAYGKPAIKNEIEKSPTLKEANILKGMLGEYSKIYLQSSSGADRNIGRIFRRLSKSLKEDINDSIDKSGITKLKEEYTKAEKNFAKNFSPFLDEDIYKFVSGNADPETIVSKFINTSQSSDLSGKLSKLAEKVIGEGGDNLLGYGYLSRALDNEGNFNPAKFATLIRNLGPNQLKSLFKDKDVRKEVLDYKNLVSKNSRALQVMFNPLTGQVNTDIAPHALANIFGGLSGLMAGGAPGAIIGTAAGPIATNKLAQFATKKLTDPIYRRKFINALIKQEKEMLPKTKKALQKGGAMIAGLSGNDQYQRPMELELVGGRKE